MYVLTNPSRRTTPSIGGLGFVWAAVPVLMGIFQGLYSKMFGCSNPDWVGLNFDPDDRKPRRIYGMTPQQTADEVNSKFIDPIANAYGISHQDSWGHVWDRLMSAFSAGGGSWGVDMNGWTAITVDFFNWLAANGKPTDPRPYFAAHDAFGVEMEATCGGGRTKRKSLVPFSQVADKIYEQIADQLPAATTGGSGGTGTTLSSMFAGIKTEYLVLGGIGLALFLLAASAKKSRERQPMYAPQY